MSDVREFVRMANQIADFFSAYPEEESVPGVAGHIRDFWTPAMIGRLAAHVDRGGEGLRPLALRAMQTLKAAPA